LGYTKLDENLVTSSVWSEDDKTLRVWVYLMARAGANGAVLDTIPAIARACGYDVASVEAVLEKLAAPDKYSRSPELEGRRVAILREPEFAIHLVNHAKYRGKDHTAAERQRRHRDVTRDNRDSHGESRPVTSGNAGSHKQKQKQKQTEQTTLSGADAPDGAAKSPERQVFDYWRSVMGHATAKFTDDRRLKVAARLREGYSVADLHRAIDGCKACPHNQGENDRGTVFDGLDLICRNGAKVEHFMAQAKGAPRGGPAPASDSTPEIDPRDADRQADELARRRRSA
jgi:hypothetical protein